MDFLTIEEDILRDLQNFDSVGMMNNMVKWHKQNHPLNARDVAILDTISRYACKYTGVCYLSKQKIAEDAGFKTRRTAIRACNKMEKLGVIKQHETRRITGDRRQSSNIILIQYDDQFLKGDHVNTKNIDEKSSTNTNVSDPMRSQQHVTAISHPKEAFYKTLQETNTYKETYKETEPLLKMAMQHSIPKAFYEAMSPFFNSKTLYDIYGVLLRAKAYIDPPFMLEDHAEQYIEHFYNVIRLYKLGKVKNLHGYLYVTWESLTAEICRQIKFG